MPQSSPSASRHMPVRPRDAASLIVIDRTGPAPRFLLGKRHAGHQFMPAKFVFPGGKAEPEDLHAPVASMIGPQCIERLQAPLRGKNARTVALSYVTAALREAEEEAGLALAATAMAEADGLRPLRFVARAITPPPYPKRFDTRFFATFRDLMVERGFPDGPDAEMSGFVFASLDETASLDLPVITRSILSAMSERLAVDPNLEIDHPVPTFLTRRGRYVMESA